MTEESYNGLIFKLGEPSDCEWLCSGRTATRVECLDSIESGYPTLLAMAQKEGKEAVLELVAARDLALKFLPKL